MFRPHKVIIKKDNDLHSLINYLPTPLPVLLSCLLFPHLFIQHRSLRLRARLPLFVHLWPLCFVNLWQCQSHGRVSGKRHAIAMLPWRRQRVSAQPRSYLYVPSFLSLPLVSLAAALLSTSRALKVFLRGSLSLSPSDSDLSPAHLFRSEPLGSVHIYTHFLACSSRHAE